MFRKKSDIGGKIVKEARSEEIQLLYRQLSDLKDGSPIGLNNLTNFWKSSSNTRNQFSDVSYIDDPIYNCVSLEPEILPIYHHPIISRLSHIKQLSFSFGYPSATHTRLSHSLGVLHLMEEALTRMFRKDKMYSKTKESHINLKKKDEADILLKAKTVSLLHDIGHGPFSHTIDRYIGFQKSIPDYADKNFSFEYLQKYLKDPIEKCGLDFEGISEILDKDATKDGFNQLIANILDSSLDVDRMTYLQALHASDFQVNICQDHFLQI
ncbi:MAG: HD domain-containing protein [Candidatus Lokiarchaeota archaeon]|nr:HD domain-containing protein [Candidatus Lokiarchaeota archaeon]